MGVDKATLPFGDQSFLECLIARLRGVAFPIVLVTNPSQGIRGRFGRIVNVEHVEDTRPDRGPIEGIRVGLKYLNDSGIESAFVTSCDVPMLQPDFVRFLSQRMKPTDEAIVPLRSPRNDTDKRRVYGISAIYRTSTHSTVEGLIAQGNLRVSDISDHVECQTVPITDVQEIDPELDSIMNVNSKADYLALLERFGIECPESILKQLK